MNEHFTVETVCVGELRLQGQHFLGCVLALDYVQAEHSFLAK